MARFRSLTISRGLSVSCSPGGPRGQHAPRNDFVGTSLSTSTIRRNNVQDRVLKLVLDACGEMNLTFDTELDVARGSDAPLSGEQSVLDAVGLVSLIIALEQSAAGEL